MRFVAIDPGPVDSAFAIMIDRVLEKSAKVPTPEVLGMIRGLEDWDMGCIVIEKIASYGMAVGREVFATCMESGRMIECAIARGIPVYLIERLQVKLALCHSPKANDSTIRAELIDRYGGKDLAIGRKASPGPLFGVAADRWAALALGVAFLEGAKAERVRA